MKAEVIFADYLEKLAVRPRQHLTTVLNWVLDTYPQLEGQIKWNQPMFTHHGTFIIGFSAASQHFSVAPEDLSPYLDLIARSGYSHGKKLVRIRYDEDVNWEFLAALIEGNLERKRQVNSFWLPTK